MFVLLGLLYFKNPRRSKQRLSPYDDRVIVTVRSMNAPHQILAGAQIPVSRIPSFPFRFRITNKNVIVDNNNIISSTKQQQEQQQALWNDVCRQDDLIIKVVVCSASASSSSLNSDDDDDSRMCQWQRQSGTKVINGSFDDDDDSTNEPRQQQQQPILRGQGISKLIRWNNTDNDSGSPDGGGDEVVVIRAPASVALD